MDHAEPFGIAESEMLGSRIYCREEHLNCLEHQIISIYVILERLIVKMKTLEELDVKLDSFNYRGDNMQDKPIMNAQEHFLCQS